MASLKEIKARIASVQSTQKITSAMRMVASAKLHKTQGMTERFLCYKDELRAIVTALGADGGSGNGDSVENVEVVDNVDILDKAAGTAPAPFLLIPISSNSGLCGAFNSNLAKATFRRIGELKARGVEARLMPVGKKIAHELRKANIDVIPDYIDLADRLERSDAYPLVAEVVNRAARMFDIGDIGGVEVIYHHFKSMGTQVITTTPLHIRPAFVKSSEFSEHSEFSEKSESITTSSHYLTEPSRGELLRSLHPRLLNAELYGTLLDSLTSEHAARMLAMQTADDNANDLLRELTLTYNKTRQQAITNELIDIMGGKTAS